MHHMPGWQGMLAASQQMILLGGVPSSDSLAYYS
jgi:hypothetical protein